MKKIFKILKRERLTTDESETIKRALAAFLAKHPMRDDSVSTTPRFNVLNFTSRFGAFNFIPSLVPHRPALAISFALILLVALSASTAYAAEATLPGDLLYPVKIHVNEPARAALTFADEAKVAWETRRVERRLEEILTLAAEKRLDAKTSEKIATRFSAQANHVEQRLEELNQTGATDAAVEFAVRVETSITAHRRVLERVARQRVNSEPKGNKENSPDQAKLEIRPIIVQLEKRATESPSAKQTEHLDTGDKNSNETSQKNRATAEALTTEATLNRARQTIEQVEADARDQALTEARAELGAAQTFFNKGQSEKAAGQLEAAIAAYRAAREHAKEAKILAQMEPKLDAITTDKTPATRADVTRPTSEAASRSDEKEKNAETTARDTDIKDEPNASDKRPDKRLKLPLR